MIVAGFDFGLSKSGVVVLDGDNNILSQNLIRVRSRGAQRLIDIEAAVLHILAPFTEEPVVAFVEGYAYGAKYQRESLAELGGVMRRRFCKNKIDFWVIPPNSLKFFVTGNGRATKNFMKKITRDKWGHAFKSDDVCDAHGLARLGVCALKYIEGVQGVNHLEPNEQEIVMDVVTYRDHYMNGNTSKKGVPRVKKNTRYAKRKQDNETRQNTTKG